MRPGGSGNGCEPLEAVAVEGPILAMQLLNPVRLSSGGGTDQGFGSWGASYGQSQGDGSLSGVWRPVCACTCMHESRGGSMRVPAVDTW